MQRVRFHVNLGEAILGIMHLKRSGIMISIENGEHCSIIWPFEYCHQYIFMHLGLFDVTEANLVRYQVFAEVTQRVVHRVFVVLMTGGVYDDG